MRRRQVSASTIRAGTCAGERRGLLTANARPEEIVESACAVHHEEKDDASFLGGFRRSVLDGHRLSNLGE
jgi:hypothetical protein